MTQSSLYSGYTNTKESLVDGLYYETGVMTNADTISFIMATFDTPKEIKTVYLSTT